MSRKSSRPSDAELRLVAPVSAVDSRHGGSRRAGGLRVCRSPNVRQLAAGKGVAAGYRVAVGQAAIDPDAFNAFEARGWEDKAASYDHFVGDITPGSSSLS